MTATPQVSINSVVDSIWRRSDDKFGEQHQHGMVVVRSTGVDIGRGADADSGSCSSNIHKVRIILRQWDVAYVVRDQELPYSGTKRSRTSLERYLALGRGSREKRWNRQQGAWRARLLESVW
ncbi:hypothetical protein D6C85_01990 [Aureobasidium pullulans]|uniref:Uncharacterized protein n=1 Tax=Aureobasidium pullulans TaxID=5580 RepID=A0A4S9XGE1_AURPU|nr:hypothetical protein D6C85_01990 [Aureobasidium pullulans]TIA27195.1 hypothetical protein D6C81_00075 [Aureobasidium pullulans]